MPYDLFISYSRNDNLEGRITELKDQIEIDYRRISNNDLICFFDKEDISGMDDWRHRILQGLRESSLLLLVLSPNYLSSKYCDWEIREYLKYEYSRAAAGQGVAPVYFIEVPGLDTKDFEQQAADWVTRIRRRNHFDLRPWHEEGIAALQRLDVRARLDDLERALHTRISKLANIFSVAGNLPMHNPYFVGREKEMLLLHESAGLGRFGVLTAIQGLGGLGKTTLAIQYAYAYADYYPGGRWLVDCSGQTDLCSVLCRLEATLNITFNEEEKHDDDRAAHRIITELETRALKGAEVRSKEKYPPSPRTLLILDNVDVPALIQLPQSNLLNGNPWLHVLATTRLGSNDFGYDPARHALLTVDELPVEDAVLLIERHQPNELFPNPSEQMAAIGIAKLLDGFTLAVEVIAVYLNECDGRISCASLLERLHKEGLAGYEQISRDTKRAVSYRQKLISATLGRTLDLLTPAETLVLAYAAQLQPENIPLPWLMYLTAKDYPDFEKDPGPGYDYPWINLVNHLIGMRLLQVTNVIKTDKQPLVVKLHRIVGQLVINRMQNDFHKVEMLQFQLSNLIFQRVYELSIKTVNVSFLWELDCLFKTIQFWLTLNRLSTQPAAIICCSVLRNYGRYRFALELAEGIIESLKNGYKESNVSIVWCHNMAGISALYLGDADLAEKHFFTAKELMDSQETDDLDRLDALTNIGSLYRETYRPELALGPCKEALAMAQTIFSLDSPEVSLRCINLGLVLQDLCNLKEAISLLEQAVKIDQSHPAHILNTCQDIATLAEALRNAGRISEAEMKAKEALQLAVAHGYEQHPHAIIINNNYAKILEAKKNYKEARIFLGSALTIAELCYDQNSPHRAFCLNNLGINSLCSGKNSFALMELLESLEIESSQIKPSFEKISHRELNLGVAYLINKDIENSLLHLNAGWGYKLELQRPDLITARFLLTRLVASFFTEENYDLFVGQFITLLEKDILVASKIDIIWSLEDILHDLVKNCDANKSSLWRFLYDAVNNKIQDCPKSDISFVNTFTKKSLDLEWP